MSALRILTLQKSADKHKIPGKNWSLKRKLLVFKNNFTHLRNGNTSKLHFNESYGNNDLKEKSLYRRGRYFKNDSTKY